MRFGLCDIVAVRHVLRGQAGAQSFAPSPAMSKRAGHDAVPKLESGPTIGVLTLRGTLNAVRTLPAVVVGVAYWSTGNHGH